MQWGHGDADYSSVVRKYLHEPTPGYSEESQVQEPLEQSEGDGSVAPPAETRPQDIEPQEEELVVSPEPVLSFSGTMNTTAPAATPLRRGFLKQLLSRFSSQEK
jgi:hypothetical protein